MKRHLGMILCLGAILPLSCTGLVKPLLSLRPPSGAPPSAGRTSVAPNAESQKLNDDAYVLISRKKWPQAAAIARKAVQLAPKWGEAHKNLALALLHTKALDEAFQHAKLATRLSPDFPKAHNVLGQIQSARGEPAIALKSFEQAIRLEPRYARAYYDAGMAYLALHGKAKSKAKSKEEATELLNAELMFRQATALEKTEPEYHLEWGWSLLRLGCQPDAEREFRIVIEKRPHEASAYSGLLYILARQNRNSEYLELANTAVTTVKPADATIFYHAGHALAERTNGTHDGEALRYFRQSLKLNPRIGRTHDGMAIIYGRNGQHLASVAASQQAVKYSPEFALAWLHLGSGLYNIGQRREGRAAWQKAATLAKKQGELNAATLSAQYLDQYPE